MFRKQFAVLCGRQFGTNGLALGITSNLKLVGFDNADIRQLALIRQFDAEAKRRPQHLEAGNFRLTCLDDSGTVIKCRSMRSKEKTWGLQYLSKNSRST